MKEFWNAVQFVFTAVGGWLGYFLGGCDGLLFALLAFVVIDYITGVMCAISDQKLSSAVGFKGICRKVLIFLMVGIANILDVYVIGTGSVLRTAAIFFYISNEGISLWRMHPIWDFRFRQRSKPCWNSFMTGQKKTKTTGKGSSFPLLLQRIGGSYYESEIWNRCKPLAGQF